MLSVRINLDCGWSVCGVLENAHSSFRGLRNEENSIILDSRLPLTPPDDLITETSSNNRAGRGSTLSFPPRTHPPLPFHSKFLTPGVTRRWRADSSSSSSSPLMSGGNLGVDVEAWGAERQLVLEVRSLKASLIDAVSQRPASSVWWATSFQTLLPEDQRLLGDTAVCHLD